MRNFRVTPIIIAIIGTILCVASPLIIWFALIQPVYQAIAAQQTQLDPVKQYVNVNQPPDLTAAQQLLKANQAKAAVISAQWAGIQRAKNPLIQSADKWRAWYQWIGFLEFEFAPRINRFLYSAKAQPLTQVSAPENIPTSPNDVPNQVVRLELGTVQVFGSYDQILQQVESWNKFNRIVMVDGLSLQGYSPFMTGSYTAYEYVWPEAVSGLPSSVATPKTITPAAVPAGEGAPAAAPAQTGAPGGFGAFGGGGGGNANAGPLPPPPAAPLNFEDTPEFHVHISNPQPAAGQQTQSQTPFGQPGGAFFRGRRR